MDQESQERFRKIDEMMLKFATNNLVIQQQIDNNNILLDLLMQSQLGLEASKERHEVMLAELKVSTVELKVSNVDARRRESRMEALLEEVKALTEESQRREFRLEDVVTLHQKALRNHEVRISQIESAA